ncbi:MAG: hypothetical protein KY455_08330 [Euryarchaeota archaeon]|nr:hypothetical protein [Euryarchaeota archaeon]
MQVSLRRAVVLALLAMALTALAPTPTAATTMPQLTVLWEEEGGAKESSWKQGEAVFPAGTKVLQVGLDRRACTQDGAHGAMVMDDWTATSDGRIFSHRSVQHQAERTGGEAVHWTVPVVGAVDVENGRIAGPGSTCFWERSWMRFAEPAALEKMRFLVAVRDVTDHYARAWVVAKDVVTPDSLGFREGTSTFLVTEEDLEGGGEARALGMSVRRGAGTTVDMQYGPTAILRTASDLATYRLSSPDGRTCTLRDTTFVATSSGCSAFTDGTGTGTWSATLLDHAGRGRGGFLWAGVDGDLFPL